MKHSTIKQSFMTSLLLALLLAASSAQAEPRDKQYRDRGPDMETRIERLTEELDLSEEQSEQLLAVMQASAAERKALRDKYEAQIKPELCALHLATVEQVRGILSAEQADELESKLERWASDGAPGGRHHGKKGHALQDCEPQP
jgi:Spy/CpxP family protein refolding chaperone